MAMMMILEMKMKMVLEMTMPMMTVSVTMKMTARMAIAKTMRCACLFWRELTAAYIHHHTIPRTFQANATISKKQSLSYTENFDDFGEDEDDDLKDDKVGTCGIIIAPV